jgi:hypothetical protein
MIGLTTTLGEYLETLDYARSRNAARLAAAMRGTRSLAETLSPADIASLDNLADDADFSAYLGDAYAGMSGKLGRELHDVLGLDSEDDAPAHCVACGEPIDYCTGHGDDYPRELARLFRGWLARRSFSREEGMREFLALDMDAQSDLIAEWVNETQDAEPSDADVLGERLSSHEFAGLD